MVGRAVCYVHGGKAGPPKGIPEHPNSRAARIEGRKRWVAEMHAKKAAGEIDKFPNGGAKHCPPLPANRKVRRAIRLLETRHRYRACASTV